MWAGETLVYTQELENKGNADGTGVAVQLFDQATPACKANLTIIATAWALTAADVGFTTPWAIAVTSERVPTVATYCIAAGDYRLDEVEAWYELQFPR